jgi:hypothetical protein
MRAAAADDRRRWMALFQVRPMPNYIVGGGCEEVGMRVVIGCGGCTATTP